MATIKIFRKKEWRTRNTVVEIYMDEQRIGYIANGETKEFEAPAGHHQLKAKMGWYGSRKVNCTLYNKGIQSFTIYPNIFYTRIYPLIVLGIVFLFIYLTKTIKMNHFYHQAFPPFIIILTLSFLILGRFTYLIIKEGINE
jgi:hypothetical protein